MKNPAVYFEISVTDLERASSDIEDTLKRAQALGSDILFPKTAVGSLGFVAEIKDSEGNRIGFHCKLKEAKWLRGFDLNQSASTGLGRYRSTEAVSSQETDIP